MSAREACSRTGGKAEPVNAQRPPLSKPDNAAPFWHATALSLLIWSTFCVGAAGAGAAPAGAARLLAPPPSDVRPVAVFGSDDRTELPAAILDELRDKIGVLSLGESNFCTAFCVATDTIATASHCLLGTQEQAGPDLSRVVFNVGGKDMHRHSSGLAGSPRTGFHRAIRAGTSALRVRPPIAAERDWALARLAAPVCMAGGLPISRLTRNEIEVRAAGSKVYQVGMHRDVSADRLVIGAVCGMARGFAQAHEDTIALDFANADAILLHTCDTGLGSSGSPMLTDGASGPEVVGINVGTYVISPAAANPSSGTQAGAKALTEAIANTAVPAGQFRRAVADFASATSSLRARAP